MTEAEKILWKHLRNGRLQGIKFRRQHPIADFIADFYCFEHKLVIEVDGGYHHQGEQGEHDRERTFELKELGIIVIRFTNDEVIDNLNLVLANILKFCKR